MSNKRWLAATAALCATVMLAVGFTAQSIPQSPAASQAVTDGRSVGRLESCKLDTTSECTITHGFGEKPSAITLEPLADGQLHRIVKASVTATSYRVRWLWHDGRQFTTQPTIEFYASYQFGPVAPEPTTPPSPTPTATPTASPTATPTAPPTPTPTVAPAVCTNPVWTTTEPLGSWPNGDAQVNNNMWNDAAGPQSIHACSYKSWYVISNQPGDGADDGVKTYPDTQKHFLIPLHSLPARLDSSWNVRVPPGSGTVPVKGKQWNGAYDLWFDNGTTATRFDTEVMVWTDWTANWQYWHTKLGGTTATIDGVRYAIYQRGTAGTDGHGIWFIRLDVANAGSVNLAALLRWAMHTDRQWLKPTQRLHEIEYGFEIMYTGEPTRFDLIDLTLP